MRAGNEVYIFSKLKIYKSKISKVENITTTVTTEIGTNKEMSELFWLEGFSEPFQVDELFKTKEEILAEIEVIDKTK